MARTQEIPAYLQSEEALKSVASYAQRKEFVRWNERAYGISREYKWDTEQNSALIRFLQDNPRAREQFEREVGITRAKLATLKQEYESTKRKGFFGRLFTRTEKPTSVREAASKWNFFKKEAKGVGQINEQGGRAINASEKERVFMDINNEMVKAWRKDIGGRLITGGLLGLLQSRTSNLNKAIRSIDSKYPGQGYGNALTSQLQAYFTNINELTKAYGANPVSRAGKEFLKWVLTPFGTERERVLQKIQSDPGFTGRLGAFLQVAIGLAVSSAMGSPSIYLGSLNTGIKIADVRNPNKDALSRILFGTTYNNILSDNDREHGRYNRMLGDNGVRGETRAALEEYKKSVQGTASEYEEATNEWFKATGGFWLFRALREVFTETEREIIVGNGPLEKKFAAIDKAITKLGDKKQTDNVRAQIAQLQRLKTLYGRRAQLQEHDDKAGLPNKYKEAQRVMNRFADYDEIKDFLMPASTKKWMKVYLEGGEGYSARNEGLLKYLWDSAATPGFQRFIKAMASGNTREYNNWVLQQEGAAATGRKKEQYGRDISKIQDGGELSRYLDSTEPGQGRLASIYAAQINNLGWNIYADPDTIVAAARSAARAQEGLLNTGRNSNNINRLKAYSGEGFYFDVPVTYTGNGYNEKVLLRIGVKPNCSNLQIGDIVGKRFYDATNLASDLKFRIPLMLQIPKKWSTKTPEKPNKPEKPGKVDGHSTPETPNYQTGGGGSTPNTGTINSPAVTPTEIPVGPGETITTSVTTAAPSGLSAGWSAIPAGAGVNLVPPPVLP